MTGTVRSRYSDLRGSASGTLYRRYIGTSTRTIPVGSQKWMTDVVGNPSGANPLDQRHITERVYLLNGTDATSGGEVISRFTNYPVTYVPGPVSTFGKFPVPSEDEKRAIALDLCASTNPSVPTISLPAFMGELKDLEGMFREIPTMIRKLGTRSFALKKGANGSTRLVWSGPERKLDVIAAANLSWRFGWAPLVSDLKKLLKFQASVERRISWLRRLVEEKSMRRRKFYNTPSFAEQKIGSNVVLQSNGGWVMADRYVTHNMNQWASVRWKIPDGVAFPITRGDGYNKYRRIATRLVVGFTCYEAIAAGWELIPWSWLVDWFIPVGQFLAASNRTLPLEPVDLCLMQRRESKTRYVVKPPPLTSAFISISGEQWEREIRRARYVLTAPDISSLVPSIPVLTAGQWSILGSLTWLQCRGGKLPRYVRRM